MILPKSELYPFTEAFNNIKNLIVFLLKHEVGVVFMKQRIISILSILDYWSWARTKHGRIKVGGFLWW